jgi:DNA-binding CsgD family transcriptional regulator
MRCRPGLKAALFEDMAAVNDASAGATDAMSLEIRRFAQRTLRSSASILYWVENGSACSDAAVTGLPPTLWGEYLEHMVDVDPLSVRAMVDSGSTIARLPGWQPSGMSQYQKFLDRNCVRDVMDMLFYADGVVVAGLGIIKLEGDAPLSPDALELADAMRPLIETSLRRHERVRHTLRNRRLTSQYHLTSREIEVAELVTDGRSNDEVADCLAIRLPTVKSHLLNIFSKTGSSSRTELARLLHV